MELTKHILCVCPTTLSLVRYVIDEFRLRDDELNEAYRRKHLWHILYSV